MVEHQRTPKGEYLSVHKKLREVKTEKDRREHEKRRLHHKVAAR